MGWWKNSSAGDLGINCNRIAFHEVDGISIIESLLLFILVYAMQTANTRSFLL
jgi:hypothetical protein